jgi:hypothetical protein
MSTDVSPKPAEETDAGASIGPLSLVVGHPLADVPVGEALPKW